LQRSLQCLFS